MERPLGIGGSHRGQKVTSREGCERAGKERSWVCIKRQIPRDCLVTAMLARLP